MKHAWWGLLLCIGTLLGCQTQFVVARGTAAHAWLQQLSTGADEGASYTFLWLRRQFVGGEMPSRFDGVVVDLHGRAIQAVRRQDGDHVLRLSASQAVTPKLVLPANELLALQAVMQRYRFEPVVISDHAGVPQVIVYAPVAARMHLSQTPGGDGWQLTVTSLARPHDLVTASVVSPGQGGP